MYRKETVTPPSAPQSIQIKSLGWRNKNPQLLRLPCAQRFKIYSIHTIDNNLRRLKNKLRKMLLQFLKILLHQEYPQPELSTDTTRPRTERGYCSPATFHLVVKTFK